MRHNCLVLKIAFIDQGMLENQWRESLVRAELNLNGQVAANKLLILVALFFAGVSLLLAAGLGYLIGRHTNPFRVRLGAYFDCPSKISCTSSQSSQSLLWRSILQFKISLSWTCTRKQFHDMKPDPCYKSIITFRCEIKLCSQSSCPFSNSSRKRSGL